MWVFPILFILKPLFHPYLPFHVQYELSASVMLHRFLCKYLCLLLNYYFSSEFPKAFKCLIIFHWKKNLMPMTRAYDESPDLGEFSILSVYLSLYVCVRESGLNVPSKYCLLPGQAAKWKTGIPSVVFFFSNSGVKLRAACSRHIKLFLIHHGLKLRLTQEVLTWSISCHHRTAGL